MSRKLIPLYVFVLSLIPLYGENIVGTMSGLLILENGEDTSAVELSLEDLASADYLYDNPFVQGIELIFELSPATRNFRNSFALYLYRAVQPAPETGRSQYRGSQFFMQILPYATEFSVIVPFADGHTLRKDADSVVTAPVAKDDFPLLVTMLPISKGLPTQAKNASVSMYARPLYANRGGLKIIIEGEGSLLNTETIVRLDGEIVTWPEDYYDLEPGFHTVNIDNEKSGSREFNIAVEAGKFTEIHHTLEEAVPQLIFTPVPGLKYYLNGVEIPSEKLGAPFGCDPGEHEISIRLNDELIITDKCTVSTGDILNISLDISILLEKD